MRKPLKNKRVVEADLVYASPLITRFINFIMQSGKKSIAEKIVYSALQKLEKQLGKTPLEILEIVVQNAGPQLELKSRRVGGANYQIPYEVKAERRQILALRWIIEAARKAKGKPIADKLVAEMLNAYNNTGAAVKKKQDTHRMADANKAFAHFAW